MKITVLNINQPDTLPQASQAGSTKSCEVTLTMLKDKDTQSGPFSKKSASPVDLEAGKNSFKISPSFLSNLFFVSPFVLSSLK